MTRASILSRLERLEQKVADMEAPEPARVVFDQTDEQLAELRASFTGKIVHCFTVCGRGCPDDPDTCPDRAARYCRANVEGVGGRRIEDPFASRHAEVES